MNFLRLSFIRKSLLAALVGCGSSLLAHADTTADPPSINEALSSAKSWLAEIDAAQYEQSYAEGCTAFHNKVPHDQWVTVLKALRPPLGPLVSRKEASHTYKPDGYEGLDGECMVIIYNSVFTQIPSEIEVVVLKREDGKWRAAGYNAQPQVTAQDDQPPPEASTTTTTQQSSR